MVPVMEGGKAGWPPSYGMRERVQIRFRNVEFVVTLRCQGDERAAAGLTVNIQ